MESSSKREKDEEEKSWVQGREDMRMKAVKESSNERLAKMVMTTVLMLFKNWINTPSSTERLARRNVYPFRTAPTIKLTVR